RQPADAPLAHWALQDALLRAQQAFDGVLENLPSRALAWALRRVVFPWGQPERAPSDALGQQVARLRTEPGAARDRRPASRHLPASADEPVGALEQALAATLAAEPADARLPAYEKTGALDGDPRANVRDLADAAYAAGGIERADYELIKRRDALRDQVIRVDDFPFDFGITGALQPGAQRKAA